MRSFLSLFIFIVSFSVNANPYQLSGEFKFTGITNAIFSKRFEPVYAFTQEGRERLTELRNQGWACVVKPRQTYLCSKANVAQQTPLSINERARTQYETLEVEFEGRSVTPTLLNQGSALTEYRFHKEVTFNGKVYPYFDYLIIHGSDYDLHKVKWGEGIERTEFLVENEGFLKKVETFADQEKKYYDIFVIEGNFR